jgi:hypothetical protein
VKDVKITAATLSKSGFLTNTNLNGVDIVDSKGVRHGNVITSINADNTILITMTSDPIVVSAGKTETLTVRFNLLSGNYTGTVSFGINSASAITSDAGSVGGTFPILGTAMNIVYGGSSLASTTLDVLTSTGSSSLNVSETSLQEITKFRIQEVSSNEGVKLYSLTLYNYGNAGSADYKDVTLEAQDGTVLATAQPSGQNVVFNLATPYLVDKGLTKDFTVKAKLIGGTTKTINLVVYNNYDIDLRGVTTGVSVIPGNGSTDSSFPVGNGYNIQTIGSGTASLSRAVDSPTASVTPGANNVVLAKFNAKPNGENMELRQVAFYIATSSSGTLLTGTVYVKVNDQTVYSTAVSNIGVAAETVVTLSSYPVLTTGVDNPITIEVSVNSSANANSTYQVKIFDLRQVKRLVTNDLMDPATGAVDGNLIAVRAAAISVVTLSTPVANSVVAGTNDFEFATIQLNAQSSGETVKVSKVIVTGNGSTTPNTNIGNYRLYKDSDTSPLSVTANTDSLTGNDGTDDTVTFNLSSPLEVTQASTVALHFKANLLSGAATGATHRFNVASSSGNIVAVGKTTGNTLTHGSDITFAGSGQVMTVVGAGTLTLSLVSGTGASPSANQVVNVNTTNQAYFAFKMTSQFETQKITSLKLTATTTGTTLAATTTIQNIKLYEGSATTPFASAAQFDSCSASACTITFTASDNLLSAAVPTTGVTIYVKADITPGGSAILGNSFNFTIASSTSDVAVKGSVSGSTSGTKTGTPTVSGISYVVPQNVKIEADTSIATQVGLTSGVTVARFKVTNNGASPVYLSTSTLTFTNTGSATNTVSFRIFGSAMGGGQSDSSGWNSGSGYLAPSGTTGASSTINFGTTTLTDAERKIDGGSWRYLTVKTSAAAINNDTFQFSVSSLGNVKFDAQEIDLGYSGNGDSDLSDTILGLFVDGVPSEVTVTAKT